MMIKRRFSPILLVILLFSPTGLFAQAPAKEGTATVAGRVMLKGEPLPGVTVELMPQSQTQTALPDRTKNVRAKTDGDGRFRMTGIVGGQYLISALAPGFVVPTDAPYGRQGKTLNVSDGESVENIELALKSGAVIAGRVTDSSGNPIVETMVRLTKLDDSARAAPFQQMTSPDMYQTDDRGAYRIWGLPAGKYRVSVGYSASQGGGIFQVSRISYPLTFHPDTTEEAQAKVVEVSEGSEATDIDIKVGGIKKAYDVSGRVVDAETGRPIAGVEIGYGVFVDNGPRYWGSGMVTSDAQGEFVLQGVLPGNYAAFISPSRTGSSEFYSELSPFAITDSDIVGIEVRAQRGGTISGTAVIENVNDPAILSKLSQISVGTYPMSRDANPSNQFSKIRADGVFRITGLPAGKVGISFSPRPPGLSLLRIESKGAPVTDGIEIHPGEQLNDVRLVFGYGTAVVRGQVKIVGGTLPEGVSLYVSAKLVGTTAGGSSWPVDGRGQFVMKDLTAGEYEMRVLPQKNSSTTAEINRLYALFSKIHQNVTVGSGGETQTLITVDLSAKEGER